jgi:protein-L-isoaspartate(D-aspartate) O-methyltransferase
LFHSENVFCHKLGIKKVSVSFATQRQNMIESQVRTNDVSDLPIIHAMEIIPREEFVDEKDAKFAYAEVEVSAKSGRKLLKARDFSKLAQACQINPGQNVLIIAGSGCYSAAVFSHLKANVTIVDSIEPANNNFTFIKDDINTLSEIKDGAYDIVFVDGAVEEIPENWFNKLRDGGKLAAICYDSSVGTAKVFVKSNEIVASRNFFEAKPPKLAELNRKIEFSL